VLGMLGGDTFSILLVAHDIILNWVIIILFIYMKTKSKYTTRNKRNKKKTERKKNSSKKKYGGRLDANDVFSKILSIGYELESQLLSKLTLLESGDEPILLNTDSGSKDYAIIEKGDFTEEELEYYENRLNEIMRLPVYTSESIQKFKQTNNVDSLKEKSNTVFLTANDVAVHPFTKYLNTLCDWMEENESDDETDDEGNKKNNLYTFETNTGEKYKINFETWQKKDCGTFTNVEWIMTYYKPYKNNNIILETFVNFIENVILHLEKLTKEKGQLFINYNETDKQVINKPRERILFHLPETNLYYLQTHYLDQELGIHDICFVPQVTFSCKIQDVVDIYKELIKSNTNDFHDVKTTSDDRLNLINNIQKCINELFENYNNSVEDNLKLIETKNPNLINSIKNYIFLILYKLHRYYNNYLTDEKVKQKLKTAKYLKDTLFFNSRHTNYDIYTSIKKCMSEYFLNKYDDNTISEIIKKLILNDKVLNEYMLDEAGNVRKNAFLIVNSLNKTNRSYGDPYYSLTSYFDFFENPLNEDETERRNDKDEIFKDWLQFSGIDVFSSASDIKDNIVLTEYRAFAPMISSYIYNNYAINDENMKNSMTNGICNKLLNNYNPNIKALSISVMKQFLEKYNKK
jgi:hypothetical protein